MSLCTSRRSTIWETYWNLIIISKITHCSFKDRIVAWNKKFLQFLHASHIMHMLQGSVPIMNASTVLELIRPLLQESASVWRKKWPPYLVANPGSSSLDCVAALSLSLILINCQLKGPSDMHGIIIFLVHVPVYFQKQGNAGNMDKGSTFLHVLMPASVKANVK